MPANRIAPRIRYFVVTTFLLIFPLCILGQSAPRLLIPHEPLPNLGQLKTRLIAYHDCKPKAGCYETDVARQTDLAISYLKRRVSHVQPNEKLALVLDIDETALSNWEEEKQDDFGYIPQDWNAWVKKKAAPAISGTLRLYEEAIEDGVSVFFITGRSSDQDGDTSANLSQAGYAKWTGLILRSKDHAPTQTVTEFKSAERQKILAEGYHIVLNVGDQMSDLNGSPQAELSVKLPNPFYYIP